jgi:hypothetical protein
MILRLSIFFHYFCEYRAGARGNPAGGHADHNPIPFGTRTHFDFFERFFTDFPKFFH